MQEIERRNPLFARVASGRESYYQPTPQINLNPTAQNLLGNFFSRNSAANNAWQYQNPQYQRVPLSSYENQAMVIPAAQQQARQYYNENLAPIIDEYVTPQLIQNALLLSTGGTLGGVAGRAAYPLAITAASKLGTPAINTVNGIANSPVGRLGAKVIDWIF